VQQVVFDNDAPLAQKAGGVYGVAAAPCVTRKKLAAVGPQTWQHFQTDGITRYVGQPSRKPAHPAREGLIFNSEPN